MSKSRSLECVCPNGHPNFPAIPGKFGACPLCKEAAEILAWLEGCDPPISIEWDGLSTWSLEVTGGVRLYQCRTVREACLAAMKAEKEKR